MLSKVLTRNNLKVFIYNSLKYSFAAKDAARNKKIEPVKLAYNEYEDETPELSDDPPLIVIHGLFGSKSNWNSIAKALNLRTKRSIVTVDCRNHGESPHAPEHTYDHLVEDLRTLFTDLEIDEAAVLGHSMGGRAAMWFALKHPSLVEKLIVADISPVTSSPALQSMDVIFDAMNSVEFPDDGTMSACRAVIDEQLSKTIKDEGLRAFLLTNLTETFDGYDWRINIDALKENFKEIATFPKHNLKFSEPTLFLAGENSDYVPVDDYKKIIKIFPKMTIKYIAEAGHWLHADKPKEFIDHCVQFLEEDS